MADIMELIQQLLGKGTIPPAADPRLQALEQMQNPTRQATHSGNHIESLPRDPLARQHMDRIGPDGDKFNGSRPDLSDETADVEPDNDVDDEQMLEQVQGQINKSGDPGDNFKYGSGLTGELENDIAVMKSLAPDDYDTRQYLQEFIDLHGEENLPEEYRNMQNDSDMD